jgi:hypothetical protein
MAKALHIIAFDMPYPADYGGVIDIYYKVKALSELGIQVKLHVFLYGGKTTSKHLEALCHQVFYYERKRFKNPFTVIYLILLLPATMSNCLAIYVRITRLFCLKDCTVLLF